tara:strand:- start:8142 stop:9278 length:1137 start_codon:yes stop_codon:yes gene_type:complete
MKKRSNPKIEAMNKRSLIIESERQNLHTPDYYLTEQVVTNYDQSYDYKKEGENYYFKKKSESEWKKASGKGLVSIKTLVFGDTEQPTEQPTVDKPKDIKGFQQYVINTIGDKNILGKGGDSGYGDDGVWGKKSALAWGKYGDKYKTGDVTPPKNDSDSVEFSKFSNPKFTIDPNELSATDSVNLSCKPGSNDCATFVNAYSDAIDVVGDAWLAHDTDGVGRRSFSIYETIPSDVINDYVEIYKEIVANGGPKVTTTSNIITKIKSLQDKLLSSKSVSGVKLDDIVGLYYPDSTHHEEAFYAAGKPYFVSGDPDKVGNTLKGGRGFSFNTHVGVVGATKDGVPLVFHNVGGTLKSDPVDKLQVTWVKRNGGNWLTDLLS